MTLFLIPARSGSKGLPGKNVMEFHGKPLIAWSIAQARDAGGVFVVVSTDSPEIAKIATDYRASAIYRPPELSTDEATMSAVIDHALQAFPKAETIVLLQPTSPVRSQTDIQAALSILDAGASAVVSVCECEHPPTWAAILPADRSAEVFGMTRDNRRQSERYHRLNGSIFAARVEYYRMHGFFGPMSRVYEMPRERSIDIDTMEDFRYAELVAKYGRYERPLDPDNYRGIY